MDRIFEPPPVQQWCSRDRTRLFPIWGITQALFCSPSVRVIGHRLRSGLAGGVHGIATSARMRSRMRGSGASFITSMPTARNGATPSSSPISPPGAWVAGVTRGKKGDRARTATPACSKSERARRTGPSKFCDFRLVNGLSLKSA